MKKNLNRSFRVIFASIALAVLAMPRESMALDKAARIDSLMNLYQMSLKMA